MQLLLVGQLLLVIHSVGMRIGQLIPAGRLFLVVSSFKFSSCMHSWPLVEQLDAALAHIASTAACL